MPQYSKVKIEVHEDHCIVSENGTHVCQINMDDDSLTSAQKVLQHIGFDVEIIDPNDQEQHWRN